MSAGTSDGDGSGEPRAADSLSEMLPSSAIRLGVAVATWRDAVRAAGDALIASGATTAAYTDEMIRTVEDLGPYIVIAPGIALAHSRPSPAVLRSGLCLVRLTEPVAFGHPDNDPVHLVIGLAAPDDKGHVEALATLAEFIADDARRTALMGATSPRSVRRLICRFEAEQPVA